MSDALLQRDVAAIGRIDAVPMILDIVCRTTGMGFAAVARVTEDRWIACSVLDQISFGLEPGGELIVETTICDEIRKSGNPVVIDDVRQDELFDTHPTPVRYGFQSYISVPIVRRNGEFFGTLCAIDPRPAQLKSARALSMFHLFADLISFHLDAQERLATNEAALLDARQTAELREQFIAVLGHDLRNPLNAISAGTALLRRAPADKTPRVLALIEKSVERMAGLVNDVLDFARGRLGGGLSLNMNDAVALAPVLLQVIEELGVIWPGRTVDARIDIAGPVKCDPVRMGQLLSNLIANALNHGAPDQPVRVTALTHADVFEMSVANRGKPIPPSVLGRIFEPYVRQSTRPEQQGLGLGLYIVSEIARAHGATVDVVSTAEETCFTFKMPLA